MANLSRARHSIRVAVFENIIFACGGYVIKRDYDPTSQYNPETNVWVDQDPLNFDRVLGCVAVEGIRLSNPITEPQ